MARRKNVYIPAFYAWDNVKYRGEVPGVIYTLDEPLTDAWREYFTQFDGVIVSEAHHRYAPEICRACVFIPNKGYNVCFRDDNGDVFNPAAVNRH